MNCIGFRRALNALPGTQEPEVVAHRLACGDCDAFARRQAAFERTLGEAVKVPVPEGLASRILVAHTMRLDGERRAQAQRRRFGLVFAAGVTAAAVGSWVALRPTPLERAVFAHIDEERSHLGDRRDMSHEQVNRLLEPLGIVVEAGVGRVHYAGTCRIRKHLGAHLVLEGAKGPVTVLLLPAEPVAGSLEIGDADFRGIVVPAGQGSMAIVGERGEPLESIEQRLRRAVRFASAEPPVRRLAATT